MSQSSHPNRRKDDQKKSHQFRSLQLLNIYRLIIATLLFSFNFVEITFIGRILPGQEFFYLSSFYLIFSIGCFLITSTKLLHLNKQVHINVLLDVVCIALFTLMSGGISSGWGTLVLAPIAGASLLLPGQTALLFASYGAVALIIQEFYGDIAGLISDTSYSQTGLIGIALFATAFLAITLARRVSESAALAEKRGLDLANLAQLNDHLINRIESGIIVVDDDDSIKLTNRAAISLLNINTNSFTDIKLNDISLELYHAHKKWLHSTGSTYNSKTYTIDRANQSDLQARITKVGSRTEDKGSVIYLSDTSEINQHIQNSKLASLGRLTASIAHEIRNPLGAISHASQLLDESESLSPDNKRLADIIHDQTLRINKIIESVLSLSRKQTTTLEPTELSHWLNNFLQEFQEFNQLGDNWYTLNLQEEHPQVLTDSNYLHQILWNICTNAIKYANNQNNQPIVALDAYRNPKTKTFYLDIIDSGPGIPHDDQDKLFEPFYTTSNSGTGLGLYISRELCLSLGGDLSYHHMSSGGSCFRIRFANNANS